MSKSETLFNAFRKPKQDYEELSDDEIEECYVTKARAKELDKE